jgi:hypothetical protein
MKLRGSLLDPVSRVTALGGLMLGEPQNPVSR